MQYFVNQAWRNIRESWGLFLQTLLMMFVSFLILGVFGGIALQIEGVLQDWEGKAPILVYLQNDITPKKRKNIRKILKKKSEILHIRYVSPRVAMKRFRRSLGKKKELLNGLDEPLFPPSFELELKQKFRQIEVIQKLSRHLTRIKGIEEIDYGREWIAPLWALARWVRGIFWVGGLLLLLGASLMASGTIRLNLLIHQDEIEIMRLVGATEHFIQIPFYLEGILEGLGAALVALLMLFTLYLFLDHYYGLAFSTFTSRPLQFFSLPQILLFVGGGLGAGAVGSWIALHFNSNHNKAF